MEKMILLQYLKFSLDLKIILLDYQSNYIGSWLLERQNFLFICIWVSYIIILIVQTKLFLELHLLKFLDILAKSFFPSDLVIDEKCVGTDKAI